MRMPSSMITCPRPSWPLAVLPSLPLRRLPPPPPPLTVTTKPLFLKSPLSSSLLILNLKALLR